MIDNYNDVMKQWTAPSQCCSNDFFDVISPNCQEHLWAVQKTITILLSRGFNTDSWSSNLIFKKR